MPDLSQSHSAVFRVISRDVQRSTPEDHSSQSHGVVQHRVVIPLNAVMGRDQLGQSSAGLCLRAPGVGPESFYEKQLDYYDKECSKMHCIVELDDEQQPRIRDFASTNGTWMLQQPDPKELGASPRWKRLDVGISYHLKPGQRIQLGQHSEYEYEYIGLTPHPHIRVRYCSTANDTLIHEHHWEWIELRPQDPLWSTKHLLDPGGRPLHGSPHFCVRLQSDPAGALSAHIEYEPLQGRRAQSYLQDSGTAIYGAELLEHEDYGDSEMYQVGYELLLPGRSGSNTRLSNGRFQDGERLFLRSRYLIMQVELDEESWTRHAILDFSPSVRIDPFVTEISFNATRKKTAHTERFTRQELEPGQYYSQTPKSLRHAIVCALVQRRLEDQAQHRSDPGWICSKDVLGLINTKVLAESDFSNNAAKWRSDISKILDQNAVELQKRLSQIVAIPQEQDWKSFVEFQGNTSCLQLRLHPGIRVEVM